MSTQEFSQENEVYLLKNELIEIYKRKTSLDCDNFLRLLTKVNDTLENEEEHSRPRDQQDLPGGIIDGGYQRLYKFTENCL